MEWVESKQRMEEMQTDKSGIPLCVNNVVLDFSPDGFVLSHDKAAAVA